MAEPVAIPVGLFKAGPSGAGGQAEPMSKIRRDIFQLTNMLYGLQMTGAYAGKDPKSVIIDINYDGYIMEDPHSSRPMSFVTDDPAKPGFWLGTFKSPNAGSKYSAVGTHTVTISVAPRQAPITTYHMTIVVPKDGATKTVTTTSTTKVPIYGTACNGQMVVVGYKDEVTTSSVDVPADTEISYEGDSVTQDLGPRDFSPAAGGVIQTFEFDIFWKDAQGNILPPYDLPSE